MCNAKKKYRLRSLRNKDGAKIGNYFVIAKYLSEK